MRLGILALAALLGMNATLAADPVVDVSALKVGEPVAEVLARLNAQGFRVVYSSALVRPEMTLRKPPKATRIEDLLREILAPWRLRAVRGSAGDWLITAEAREVSTPTTQSPPGETIDTIDVTATRMRLAVADAGEMFLDRQDVERMPHLADDALRALKVLPGVTGGDFSAALNVRGGKREEARLTIDGAEIHNAFHFRDIDGALSVLDTGLVESIDFVTGGMTADVGDYLSGAIGMTSRRPSPDDAYRSAVGISFVSAYARSSGTFAQDRGSWLLSARRGFLDMLASRVVPEDEQLTPRYADVFAAGNVDFSPRTALKARFLLSDDDLTFTTPHARDDIDSAGEGHSRHLWFVLDHDFPEAIRSSTMVAAATVRQRRDSEGTDDFRSSTVFADNHFRFFDLRQDWSWALGDAHLPRWGFSLGDQRGDYDYAMYSRNADPLLTPVPVETAYGVDREVRLRKAGVYAAWRTRLGPRLTAEAGLRWDTYRYDGERDFDSVSPRLNLVYAFGANELRAAWGRLYQPQSVNELQVEDNVDTFFAPEQVRQAVIGYTRRFANGFSARLDLYDKDYRDLRPRFENALDPLQLIPEGADDRIRIDASRARARGMELTLRREAERGIAGWVSYSRAWAEDFDDARWVARSWAQEHTLSFGGSWTGSVWNVSLAGLIHSGTPTTALAIETTPLPGGGYDVAGRVGARNAGRFDAYARVDLRVNRDIQLANSKVSLYLEITNLLDRDNECCVEDYELETRPNAAPVLALRKGYWLPLLPSLGFQLEF